MYLICWLGEDMPEKWLKDCPVDQLVADGLIEKTEKGYVHTKKGRFSLSHLAGMALKRPKDYAKLSFREQWEIDRGLGILDWDGT